MHVSWGKSWTEEKTISWRLQGLASNVFSLCPTSFRPSTRVNMRKTNKKRPFVFLPFGLMFTSAWSLPFVLREQERKEERERELGAGHLIFFFAPVLCSLSSGRSSGAIRQVTGHGLFSLSFGGPLTCPRREHSSHT